MITIALASCLLGTTPSFAALNTDGSDTPLAVIVKIAIPKDIPRAAIEAEFQKAAPVYQAIPGLMRKYFTIAEDGKVGGIYLWENCMTAEAFYNDAWKASVEKKYGVKAEIQWFYAPTIIEGVSLKK